jgi:mevalonate kinase
LNHGLLASLGLSHKSLEHVREVTNKYETKSKLTGAGGGGCALSLLKPNTTQMTINSMQNELLERGWDSYSTNMGGPGIAFQNCPNLTSQDFLSSQELSLVAKIPPNWSFLTKL